MAAVASAPASASASASAPASALTPPSSSHGDENDWNYSDANIQPRDNFALSEKERRSAPRSYSHDSSARKMPSTDNMSRFSKTSDSHKETLPGLSEQEKAESDQFVYSQDQSKWIHRDKLARIETEELHAAGFILPKGRTSRQRLNESRLSNNTESEPRVVASNRNKKDSASLEPMSSHPSWDLRTAQEIADAETESYFTKNALTGRTRIPVAKTSPVPISIDFLEHGSLAAARQNSDDDDGSTYVKPRSQSASAAIRSSAASATGTKRSVTDTSPDKHFRKTSVSTPMRPATRSKDSSSSAGSRPVTRSGRTSSRTKHPDGDPPWMANTFKPDPRLPPDQQIPPFVAKRMAQEQMEKNGTFGNAYDKNFRPLNTNSLATSNKAALDNDAADKEKSPGNEEWPLKPAVTNRPLMRTASMYSTMPKISDKPPATPVPSPLAAGGASQTPQTSPQRQQQQQHQQQQEQRQQQQQQLGQLRPEEIKKGGCGCCVVM